MTDNTETELSEAAPPNLLQQARELLYQADPSSAFLLAKQHWLSNPTDLCAVRLICEIMRKAGRKDLFNLLDRLSANDYAFSNDTQVMFEAAYKFIDAREPELAALLLTKCVDRHPDEKMIRYELGFALMQMRRFTEAIPHFEFLASIEEDFDTWLNLTVCHSIGKNLLQAREGLKHLERLKKGREQECEVNLRRWVLKRMERFDCAGVRDWVFCLYGAMLLSETSPRDLSGKPMAVAADYTGVATTLLVLRGLMQEIGTEFDVIEYYSPLSCPLAEAFARLTDLPAALYGGPQRKERSLLMIAWASDIVGPHRAFIDNFANRSIFAYGLTSTAQLPITPDVIGCLAAECAMPWSRQLKDMEHAGGRGRSKLHPLNEIQAQATDLILQKAANLESQPELIRRIEELVKYYSPRREMLVLRNCSEFPLRPEYTAEIPC